MTTFFLIDDDPDDRDIFEMALNDIPGNHRLVLANNGVEALNVIKRDELFLPDFIFLDLNMPLISGKDCLQQIKTILRLENIPVIIYTTSSYQKDIDETRRVGASHFLVKPTGLGKLSSILTDLLNNKCDTYCLGE